MVKTTITVGKSLLNRFTDYSHYYQLSLYSAGESVDFYTDTGSLSQANDIFINDGEWHHIVVSMGTDTRIYVDGKLDSGSIQSGKSSTSHSGNFEIGREVGGGENFDGLIDHLYVYNRGLSADEALLLYREHYCMFQKSRVLDKAVAAGLSIPIAAHHYKMLNRA